MDERLYQCPNRKCAGKNIATTDKEQAAKEARALITPEQIAELVESEQLFGPGVYTITIPNKGDLDHFLDELVYWGIRPSDYLIQPPNVVSPSRWLLRCAEETFLDKPGAFTVKNSLGKVAAGNFEKPQPSMEVLRVIKKIDVTLHDLNMDEAWQKLKPLIPAGDSLFIDPIKFKSANPRIQTLPKLYKQKYGEVINERLCREAIKWAQEHGELLITSVAGVRYATSKDEYHDWARTQLRHAFTILDFWRKVVPALAQEIEGQLKVE